MISVQYISLQKYKISNKPWTPLLKENKKPFFQPNFWGIASVKRPLFGVLFNKDPNANGELLIIGDKATVGIN